MGEMGETATGTLQPATHALLKEHVVDELRGAIFRGTFPRGTRLREPALAAQFGVSRGPIRDALVVLEQEGLVVSEPRRGVRVAKLTRSDVEEIYEVRRALEIVAARRAAVRMTPPAAAGMRSIVERMGEHFDADDLIAVSHLDVSFHDSIFQVAASARLSEAWRALRSQVTLFLVSRNSFAETDRGIVVEEHKSIIEALEMADADLAEHRIRDHLFGAFDRLDEAMAAN